MEKAIFFTEGKMTLSTGFASLSLIAPTATTKHSYSAGRNCGHFISPSL
jgi:hypothetical protein